MTETFNTEEGFQKINRLLGREVDALARTTEEIKNAAMARHREAEAQQPGGVVPAEEIDYIQIKAEPDGLHWVLLSGAGAVGACFVSPSRVWKPEEVMPAD